MIGKNMTATTGDRSISEGSTVTLGIALALLGTFMFSANDVLGKWLVGTYSVGQVLLLRSFAALLILAPFVYRAGWRSLFVPERPGVQIFRAVLGGIEVCLFYLAVVYLPLADVMAYYLAGPIYVAALSPFVLSEHVGWRRWTAIVVGFGGVLVVLQPSGETLTLPAFISLAGSFAFGLILLTGRMLRRTPDLPMVFWPITASFVVGGVLAPASWVQPDVRSTALLALLGLVSMLAHVCTNRSLKLAPAATVAPIQYTLLLWAIVFGWTVFGDVPRPSTLIGGAIIVAAGLFIFFREQKKAVPPPPPQLEI